MKVFKIGLATAVVAGLMTAATACGEGSDQDEQQPTPKSSQVQPVAPLADLVQARRSA